MNREKGDFFDRYEKREMHRLGNVHLPFMWVKKESGSGTSAL